MIDIRGRRFIVVANGGGGEQPGNDGEIVITVMLNGINGTPGAQIADFKYNKDLALILEKDDGGDGDYKTLFRWLEKGENFNGSQGTAPTYTDGCGNPVKWKASFAVPTIGQNGDDMHNGVNPTYTTWAQYAEAHEKGWTLLNHAYGEDADTKYEDREATIKMNEIKFFNELIQYGVYCRTRHLVIPDTQEGFTSSAFSMGYKTVGSAFGLNSDDGQNDKQFNITNFNVDRLMMVREHLGDEWVQAMQDYAIPLAMNRLFGFKGQQKAAITVFSHGPGIIESQYNYFKQFTQYVSNRPDNNDCLWVPSVHEFWDYLETKKKSVKTELVTGNTLKITINQNAIPVLNQFRDLSLIINGGSIASVNVTGADGYSFNGATGLINVRKKKTVFLTPELDARPAKLLSATAAGNSIALVFESAITQSIAGAWSVQNNTVTGISGSGTNWSIDLANPTSAGTKMYYRMQNGDATTVSNGLKICSFIEYPIS
ncbi:hypothetical protein [Pedobacter suwonensis]|uniref:hypothetical protein n=1 Tax=Pedobacter suwonensis TaxID=332999 RepID=UPI0011A97CAF|nr:hypothetical protein [Pedobacter suwonensis]